jgi:hypothetical protein
MLAQNVRLFGILREPFIDCRLKATDLVNDVFSKDFYLHAQASFCANNGIVTGMGILVEDP